MARRRLLREGLGEMLEGESPVPREKETAQTFKRRSMNVDLQKSLKLLDEAVAPVFPGQGLSRTPRSGLLRHSHQYTPKKVSSASKFDISDMYTPTHGSLTVNVSETLQQSALPLRVEMEATEDLTTTNINLLMDDDDPGIAASMGLFSDFEQCLRQNGAPHQVLDLLSDYETAVSEQVSIIRKLVRRARLEQLKFKKTYGTLDLLDKERSTWQLIHSLFKDRLETQALGDTHLMEHDDDDPDMALHPKQRIIDLSEQEITSKLFEKDADLRQCQLVVDWLENCAREDLDEVADNVKFFTDRPVVWENTLHHLQTRKKGTSQNTERPLVDQLDPDAPVRQKRYLDDLDKEDEQRLLQHLFMCIRAGQLDKAQELCQSCGQAWRAATLEGWRLYHDANHSRLQATITPVTGNPHRDVWKRVCWRMATEGKYDPFETAIYAVLSGNLKGVLPVCHSWYDYLWAYFRTLVDVRVEQEVRLRSVTFRSPVDLPQLYWDCLMEPAQVFEELQACSDQRIRKECEQWYHVIQRHIILGDMSALVEVLYDWAHKHRRSLPHHLLRFMAHLVLFLRRIGHDVKEDLCTVILEAYVERLIESGQKQLIAHYVSTLPAPQQVQWYAHFLEGVKGQEERQACLRQGEEAGLDVAAITKRVVENIRHRDTPVVSLDTSLAINVGISEDDRQKIEAIDWLVFDPAQRAEALKQANAVMRSFIVLKKHNAAREVFNKLPADSIDVVYKMWHAKTGSTSLPPSDDNALREYMCMQAYLDAMESYNDWFSLYHHSKPAEPSGADVGSSFTDRVAQEHRMKQYLLDRERWQHNLLRQTQITKDRIYNVLLFMDGGWMVDRFEDPGEEESRGQQLALLRKVHIPALCLNLHHMLHASGMYSECLQLADCIASEYHQLYKEFSKDDLKQLLRQIRESSLSLLDQNKDPLGYELV
ncbi:nuclear pore complex protein Nup107-like [Babylonia areolata]|uniref:nuclear pore complex protein Nup107-like n=1 Tax=Babylonia areolata TaxID=304850 RepID=UPI003FD56438